MPKPSEYLTYLLELLAPLGQVSSRAMFGGYGIYRDGVLFALEAYVKPTCIRDFLSPSRKPTCFSRCVV